MRIVASKVRFGVVAAVATLALTLPAVALGASSHVAIAAQVRVTITGNTLLVSPHQLTSTGPAVIFVANQARSVQVLTIKGPGLNGAQTRRVAAGASMQLHLKLLAGAYEVATGSGSTRYLVVTSNVVGPPVNAPAPQHAPTSAVATGAMDCAL